MGLINSMLYQLVVVMYQVHFIGYETCAVMPLNNPAVYNALPLKGLCHEVLAHL